MQWLIKSCLCIYGNVCKQPTLRCTVQFLFSFMKNTYKWVFMKSFWWCSVYRYISYLKIYALELINSAAGSSWEVNGCAVVQEILACMVPRNSLPCSQGSSVSLIILGNGYRLWNASACNLRILLLLPPPSPNILTTLFTNIQIVCSSYKVGD